MLCQSMSNISQRVNFEHLSKGVNFEHLAISLLQALPLIILQVNYNIHTTPASDMVCSHAAASRSRFARAKPVITRASP